jgi:hypothetical protein
MEILKKIFKKKDASKVKKTKLHLIMVGTHKMYTKDPSKIKKYKALAESSTGVNIKVKKVK